MGVHYRVVSRSSPVHNQRQDKSEHVTLIRSGLNFDKIMYKAVVQLESAIQMSV